MKPRHRAERIALSRRKKKKPVRTCIGCRQTGDKRDFWRLVRTPEGRVEVDPTGRQAGRGAYLCPKADCLERAFSGKKLESALRTAVSAETSERLREDLAQALKGDKP